MGGYVTIFKDKHEDKDQNKNNKLMSLGIVDAKLLENTKLFGLLKIED